MKICYKLELCDFVFIPETCRGSEAVGDLLSFDVFTKVRTDLSDFRGRCNISIGFRFNMEYTLWSGDGSSKLNKNGHADLGHLRKLLKDQKHQEAEDYCRKHILGDWTDSYLPAGRLNMSLQMSGQKLHLGISLESEIRHEKIKSCEDTVILFGRAPSYVAPPYYDCPEPVVYEDGKGIRFTLAVKAVAPGGSIKCCDGKLLIEGEQDIFVYFTGNTDFGRNADAPQLEKECMEVLKDPDYEQLKKRHLGEYRKYFNRMELSLNDTRENRLAEMMFHYARYLMICSSRPGSQCANFQGIWNNRMRAPWSSNYTVNINTEMNYWMAERCNLGECQEPLFDLICRTAEDGKETAREIYGLSGWVSHHNLDIWGHSGPVGYFGQDKDPCSYSMWPMSSG